MAEAGAEREQGEAELAERLLLALEQHRPHPEPGGTWPPPAGGELEAELQELMQLTQALGPQAMSDAVCDLSQVLYQLRAWYCVQVGLLVLVLLERVAALPQRLPSPRSRADASLAVLRLLEGLLLMCTVFHASQRVVKALEQLLRKRRLPPTAGIRLEATLVCLSQGDREWPGVPKKPPLDEEGFEDALLEMATSLESDSAVLERVRHAKEALERAASEVFPGCRVEYFGSSVNGFETFLSDVDCVVQLPEATAESLLELGLEASQGASSAPRAGAGRAKASASVAARVLGDALRKAEELQPLGLVLKEVIIEARVPLVKCESAEGVAIDISFNNRLPLHNSQLLRAYAELDTTVPQLGRLVKLWAKRRHVNDAQEGTLSSYSHILLVIHYLQHIGYLPNLQDKSLLAPERLAELGRTELLDGRHDVWFLDATRVDNSMMPELQEWTENAPDEARLAGLLAGFFHYFAYEFPMHSQVISIRLPGGRVPKLQHFRLLAAARSAADAEAGAEADAEAEAEAEAEVEATPEAEEEEEEDSEEEVLFRRPCLCEEEDDALSSPGNCPMPPPLASTPAPALPALPAPKCGDEEEQALHRKKALPPEEHWAQHQISGRQVLCIDDPMELGRTLCTTFQGMERLSYEFRRGCALLGDGAGEDSVHQLFSGEPAPARSIWKLTEQFRLPSVLVRGASARPEGRKTAVVPIPRAFVGKVMGRNAAQIRELQAMRGLQSVRLEQYGAAGASDRAAELRIVGEPEAVAACEVRVKELLSEQPREARGAAQPTSFYSQGSRNTVSTRRSRWGHPGRGGGSAPEHARQSGAEEAAAPVGSSKGRGRGRGENRPPPPPPPPASTAGRLWQ